MTRVNAEGLTFKEWVCATGLASFDDTRLKPYQETRHHRIEDHLYYALPLEQRRELSEIRGALWITVRDGMLSNARYLDYPVRVVNYPRRLRKAWAAGECPTEYRKSA
jgi:hypothetical protein